VHAVTFAREAARRMHALHHDIDIAINAAGVMLVRRLGAILHRTLILIIVLLQRFRGSSLRTTSFLRCKVLGQMALLCLVLIVRDLLHPAATTLAIHTAGRCCRQHHRRSGGCRRDRCSSQRERERATQKRRSALWLVSRALRSYRHAGAITRPCAQSSQHRCWCVVALSLLNSR
jgi:hypothetical protein